MTLPIAEYLMHCLRLTIDYGDELTTDIPDAIFAHIPHPGMNHPAFCIGHLSLYPNELLRMVGRKIASSTRPVFSQCSERARNASSKTDATPPKHEIVHYYLERHQVLCDAIRDVGDDLLPLMQRSPQLPFKRWFPTVGSTLVYYLNNHHMQHLGQISAWRRVVGLDPLKWGEPDPS